MFNFGSRIAVPQDEKWLGRQRLAFPTLNAVAVTAFDQPAIDPPAWFEVFL